jgi:hypothetical protein
MSPILQSEPQKRHLLLPETFRATAKADLKTDAARHFKPAVAHAFTRACDELSLKELSAMLPLEDGHCRDERQIGRWQSGLETVQVPVVMQCWRLWLRFLEELARIPSNDESGDVWITTQISIRRRA